MKVFTEIYLKKEEITSDNWQQFIKYVSIYLGMFQPWRLFVVLKENRIHYYIESSISFPPVLEKIDFFLLKESNHLSFLKKAVRKHSYLSLTEDNLIMIYDKFLYKKALTVNCLEILFFPFSYEKIYSKSTLYFQKENLFYRRKVLFSAPTLLLRINFRHLKTFSYQKVPTYCKMQKALSLFGSEKEDSIFKVDLFPYRNHLQFLNLSRYDFHRHSLILGSSGSGKSKLVSSMIAKLKKEDYKVIVIDPHASLEKEIGGMDQTEVINFKTNHTSINLFKNYQRDIIASVELFLSLFESLMAPYYNMKLERVLRHSFHLLLIGDCFTFTNLRNLLLDIEYRYKKLEELEDQLPYSVFDFFHKDFNELKNKSYMESIAPILAFIDEMQLLQVFHSESEVPSLLEKLETSFLTIISLDRTQLGDHLVKTISGFLMQQLLGIIQSHSYLEKIVLVVDEVAVVENPILLRMLSESRKYGFALFLISQYFNQISKNLKDAIFANTINYYIFRSSRIDAVLLVDTLNVDFEEKKDKEFKIDWLTKLNDRECVVRISNKGKLCPSFKAVTLDYSPCPYQECNEMLEEKKMETEYHTYSWEKSNVLLHDILLKLATSRRK